MDRVVEVVQSVEQARVSRGLSKAELARRSCMRPEMVRRLLTGGAGVNPSLGCVLDMLRPLGFGLALTTLPPQKLTSSELEVSSIDRLKGWLAFYGAPLYGPEFRPEEVPPPETVLADALVLAHESASVSRALPLAFWKTRDRLDFHGRHGLFKESVLRGQARTLGFFLDLTSQLSGDLVFEEAAKLLKVRDLSRPKQFFSPTTWRERQLAEMRTPQAARKWGFRMNMGMDSFETMFNKGEP
jgi:transcriptional regulator with XRE-family HTH domain